MRDSSILPTLSTIFLRMGGRLLGLLDERSDVVIVDVMDVVEGPAPPPPPTTTFPATELYSSTTRTTADVDAGKAVIEVEAEAEGVASTIAEGGSLRPMSEEGLVAWSRK